MPDTIVPQTREDVPETTPPRWSASLEARTTVRVAGAAVLTALAVAIVHTATGSLLWAALAALAVAAVCGYIVARWSAAPVRRLIAWAAEPDLGHLRFLTGDEWQALARLFFVRRRDALERAREAEAELAHLSAVLLTMADGVLLTDRNGRVVLANGAAEAMFGARSGSVTGRAVLEATTSVPLEEAVREALSTGVAQSREIDVAYPAPRHLRAMVNVSGEGDGRAAVVVLHDLTDAIHVDAMRRDFVANVSHELRNPVAGILANAENLRAGAMNDPAEARRAVGHIASSARRLSTLLDDLLSLARAEAGGAVEKRDVPVGPIARAVVAELDPAISVRGLNVSLEVPDNATVSADPESVRQILRNLVDNAVNYTPEGGSVDIRAAVEGQTVRLAVTDTGIGIPRQHQSRVFERFYRVDPARSRLAGGTGLGLSIVKHLVESLGGTIALESEPERGSTFTVTLPGHG